MPKRRLGVALLVPPPVCHEVDGLRRALGDGSLGRIPAHLTLVPPVNVRDDRIGEAIGRLREAAALIARPLRLELGPVRTFLPDNPVLYLCVGGDDLGPLRELRDAVFREPLERPLTWPFVPHVTIADEADPKRIEQAVSSLASWRMEVAFHAVTLLEEGPGRVWSPVADVALAPATVVARGPMQLELTTSTVFDDEVRAFATEEWRAFDVDRFGPTAPDEPYVITARRLGVVVGFASGEVIPANATTCHLSELLVDQGERGTGVGSHLLAAVEHHARARGATRISLNTEAGGPSQSWYEHRGYAVEALLPLYNYGRDFVRMSKPI